MGLAPSATRGVLKLGDLVLPCALGRSGRRTLKREGDGATPVGRWCLLQVLYRADRIRRPATALPVRQIKPDAGWCDAPADRNYNRPVRHPYPASAERLWRTDGLYDIVVVLSHNVRPRVRGGGSAIFMHVAQPGYSPTAGCIALRGEHLRRLLERLGPGAAIRVRA
jgi:L,D-peptidoglycan transpeptidase YkuD (ErfK/YbiS/YcfS/YnhG family)